MAEQDNDEGKLVIAIEPTKSSCVGSACAYLLRTIAARAGSYAPGIEERMFHELERREGGLPAVESWLAAYHDQLSYLGYRFMVRRVAFRTDGIVAWVRGGEGFRGALLPTDGKLLHPEQELGGPHAVALVTAPNGAGSQVKMIDPVPESGGTLDVPANLDDARRDPKWAGLLVFWSGHS